ncbi:Phage-related protein [Erwinia billingiae Eb661]|uniref:Phage-related protein n=1 Tax=Erwinia billingiae (strain Eb661) TaxID=634500 RepID=D8MP57_ERWBE|nr:TraR/DksA C4-type zinc finger protein [Erwinia billingiae]CAX58614.1 Phage-related protein [Erwinia billingiae Eb661]
MADSMDLAQQREAENLARSLANVINRPVKISAFFCEKCEAPILEERRKALIGVTLCVTCKQVEELHASHFRGASV